MTVEGDTVFYLAATLSSKSQGTKVLEMFINILRNSTSQDERRSLRVPNNFGNNILHEVSVSGNEEGAKYLMSNFNEPVPEEVVISTSTISTSTTDKQPYEPKLRDSENGLPDGDVVTPNQKDDVESSMDSNHPGQSIFRNKLAGIVPTVQEILEQRPQAGQHVNENERNILNLAIKNRQKEILDPIQSKPTLMWKLNKRIDHNGNTILHQVADRTYYSIALSQKLIGPAMQLQEELRLMLRIKEMLPPHYIMHHNDNDPIAEELFNAGHDELLKSAQEWVKETAQSCSTVAVLVATVVFAAACAIHGGFNDKSGRPVFQDNPLFLLFTCMDIVAIACSLSSVAFFLSVLSFPLEYPYFVKRIPHKVMIRFLLLFLSMVTTMLAFAATILLLIRVKKKWTMSLLYPIAFFPIPIRPTSVSYVSIFSSHVSKN
ncbi:ankyrin repeat-containing protein NPR4-like [Pyrus communis]|uniref:ankyrin repeat-containing protein NPR4-like n=1 Tax=Pyrus communis TaxID=23211 RepID=UPI0035C12623